MTGEELKKAIKDAGFTISRALGHATSGASVTMTYINYNSRKIDEANRLVIDYVFGKHAKNEP